MSNLQANQRAVLDGDRAYRSYTGSVRVRDAGAGQLLLQVSVPNAQLFDISTFVVNGGLRDTMAGSATEWPDYQPQDSLHDLPTTTSEDALRELVDVGSVTGSPTDRPISPSDPKAGR